MLAVPAWGQRCSQLHCIHYICSILSLVVFRMLHCVPGLGLRMGHALQRALPQEFFLGAAGARGHGERGGRAYNGDLGAEPPAGSRDRVPVQGVSGLEAGSFEAFAHLKKAQEVVQGGFSIFQHSGQVLPSRGKCPKHLLMPMGAHDPQPAQPFQYYQCLYLYR